MFEHTLLKQSGNYITELKVYQKQNYYSFSHSRSFPAVILWWTSYFSMSIQNKSNRFL